MFFQALSLVQLLPLILAAPVPQQGGSVSSLPGVNITNGYIASTNNVVKNSYIVVLKDNVTSATVTSFHDKVSRRVGSGLKNKYRFNPGQNGQKSFQAVQVTTDAQGLSDIAKDPAVSELDNSPNFS